MNIKHALVLSSLLFSMNSYAHSYNWTSQSSCGDGQPSTNGSCLSDKSQLSSYNNVGTTNYQNYDLYLYTDGKENAYLEYSFSMNSGDTFSFDWLWQSQEDSYFASYFGNDYADITMSFGGNSWTETIASVSSNGTYDTGAFSWIATASDTLNFRLGVTNLETQKYFLDDSYLKIGEVCITEGVPPILDNPVSAVPEASSIAMMLGGLGLVSFMAARRKKQA